jgi:Asp-tRNA(Asn)/Glu-tRNA(Gln) amidotransferase A subunit family amidase
MLHAPVSASAVLAEIARGALDPRSALERFAARIGEVEPRVKAFAHLDLEAARASLPAQAGRGPLRGLPVAVKDIFDTADMPTAYGTTLYAGHRPAADAAIVALVRRAGGTIPGKAATTAFANLDPAPTENPRAFGHTPGGSSSGSAAAVSAGMAPFAIGTQTGGSVVRPASYCGVVGYKPSYRMLPATGMKTFSWHLDTVGLFAATVADVAFLAEALSGRALRLAEAEPSPMTLGLLQVPDWSLAEPAMADAVMTAARRAEALGCRILDLPADPALIDAWDCHATIQNHEAARAMAYEVDRFGDAMPPLVLADLKTGWEIPAAAYDEARRVANRARKLVRGLFAEVDAVLMPAAPGAPPETLASTGRAVFNRFWTLMGDPCLAVPGLADGRGLPLGVQVIGPFGRDAQALAAARLVERALAA